ncbi:chromosome segregation protein SMC [Clostridium tyrobutyricum]|uniref:chromosome segregation protein SMC n=1 Tax=Clostridium tyrobutyricum TaxID=1519 RepID=UPI00242AC802|nr:chromosome segregation protein SMC [Clostridium tyrobutyricum]
MYLKAIEIRGFKSFADKTKLTLTNGVTSIVGPNGSGKSNISDAVRWVLGEQSVKNLRGGKMEDVIFSGTQFRKPVGLCQVSLNLDNSDKALPLDYTSITVLRRLYRSGESEYYINSTRCRLKDIYELFMDTGIGREGYSIIGQGKIDAVLSGKPEDRRSLLEEAAGIVKFKWRKGEAEKKLKNTNENLIRIDDIMSAYKDRLEPLSIENDKANRFLKLSEGLKEKEINLLIHSIDEIRVKVEKLRDIVAEKKENVDNLNLKFVNLKCKIDKFNKNIDNIIVDRRNCEKNYYDSKSEVQALRSKVELLKEKISNIENIMKKNDLEYDTLKKKMYSTIDEKTLKNNELSKLCNIQVELNNEIEEHQCNLDKYVQTVYNKNELIRNLKDSQIEYLSTISNLKNSISTFTEDIKKTIDKIENLKETYTGYENSLRINFSTKDVIDLQIRDIEKKIKKYEAKIVENKKSIINQKNYLKKFQQELKQINSIHMRYEANRNMLINLDNQYEGYNRAVKMLMKHIKSGKAQVEQNSCFVLGEIIKVDKQFEVAIEIALGGAISNIITKDEKMAKHLIKYLKSNNLGRATFLPLTIIKARKISENKLFSKIDGYLGIASDIVECDSYFKNALEYVLGRTIISRDIDSALNIAKTSNYTVRIVTLQGEIVNPGGALTGGSLKSKASNIIGRKREIKSIDIKLGESEGKIKSISQLISNYEESIRKFDEENLNLRDDIYSKNIDITELKGKINNINNENLKLEKNIDISKKQIQNHDIEIKEYKKELESKKLTLKNFNNKQSFNNESILTLEEDLKGKNETIDNTREKLTALKIKKAKVDEGILNINNALKNHEENINEFKNKILNLKNEANDFNSNIKKYYEEIKKNKLDIEEKNNCILKFENIIKKLKIDEIKIKDKVKILNGDSQNLALEINKKEQELHKSQLNLTKFIANEENMYSKLNSDMKITYEEALKYKFKIENVEEFKTKIQNLKKQISDIGVVNLGAIEEYKELKQKVDFMESQKQDLINANNELNNVIYEMTDKIKVVFNANFNKLRKNFNETFKELFKGGSADIIITNGDELTGDIDITVQPPGKKLQNINLMSGGEKGLSAIALLFAILKMKPTPFCILDEIEAALDDANVARYAEFLKKFSKSTQFIVITHRKGTMEVSDVLYGVTMEEKGISKIVSVDLNENIS